MKLRYIFNFLVICIVVISCNSYDMPDGTPDAIKNKILDFDNNAVCDSSRVELYEYEGKNIYCFVEPCCCDIGNNWYDENAELICVTGTIGGTISCDVEIEKSKFIEVIWQE